MGFRRSGTKLHVSRLNPRWHFKQTRESPLALTNAGFHWLLKTNDGLYRLPQACWEINLDINAGLHKPKDAYAGLHKPTEA